MGRLVLVLLGVLTVAAFASTRAADPPSLKGTWVRESMVGPTMGYQIILTFTDHRVTARFRSGGRDPGGQEGWITLEFEGEYARTDSGLLVGTITGMNVDLSKIPEGDSTFEPVGKSIAKMIGEPFCLRARVSDGALTVTDLKVPDVDPGSKGKSREKVTLYVSGKYKAGKVDKVAKRKTKETKKTESANSMDMAAAWRWLWFEDKPSKAAEQPLPSPKYLDHYPQYFQQEPAFPLQKELNAMIDEKFPDAGAGKNSDGRLNRRNDELAPTARALPVPSQSPFPVQVDPRIRAEALLHQGFTSSPIGEVTPLPANMVQVEYRVVAGPGDMVVREIDLGEAGTIVVSLRPKNAVQPKKLAVIPSADQLAPAGSMKGLPILPEVEQAWKKTLRLERIDGGIMK